MGQFNRITFTVGATEYNLGYHEWINFSSESNPNTKIIPRAKGVSILNGEEMGGGLIKIKVGVFIVKNSVLEFESYVYSLISDLTNKEGTLTIENSLILENCVLTSISQNDEKTKTGIVTIDFIKSL